MPSESRERLTNDQRAFAGLKVVDVSQGIAGPLVGMLLAQHGADVIKVENTGDGDWVRKTGGGAHALAGAHSALSVMGNMGKRSIALDLKTGEGRDILWRLLGGADVFIEGFRPGVIDKLGFGYKALASMNKGIVYLSMSGFGQTGPMRDRPATDPIIQAYTGIMETNRDSEGRPRIVRSIPVDMISALFAFQAVAPALYARARDGQGRHIEMSLIDAAAWLNLHAMLQGFLAADQPPPKRRPPNDVYQTADGWIVISVLEKSSWTVFCEAIEAVELATDVRFATTSARADNADILMPLLRAIFKARPTVDWNQRLTDFRIPNAEVKSPGAFLNDPHLGAIGMISELTQPGFDQLLPMPRIPGLPGWASGSSDGHAPLAGADSEAILAQHGYDDATIARLLEAGIISTRRS